MAFHLDGLRKVQRSGMTTWWNYSSTEDTVRTIRTRGYFDPGKDRFAVGDWVFISGTNGGTILHVNEIDPLELAVMIT